MHTPHFKFKALLWRTSKGVFPVDGIIAHPSFPGAMVMVRVADQLLSASKQAVFVEGEENGDPVTMTWAEAERRDPKFMPQPI